MRGRGRALLLALLLAVPWLACRAGALRYCDDPPPLSAAQKDRLFRFGAVIKAELEASGRPLALIARSGLDLARFGVRYSHAGLSLQGSTNTPWSVRQLYYACDEKLPRIYDQGLAGFLLGLSDPGSGYVSVVLLPEPEASALARVALDDRRALQALAPRYSANAYAFGLRYQNCNQWVAELLAAAWGRLDAGADLRAAAQAWLKQRGYVPTSFEAAPPLLLAGLLVPWLHRDDHPAEDLERGAFRVSTPASIEAFVRATVPGATRIEFCHAPGRVVIRRGWEPLAEGCVAQGEDRVVVLD